MNIIRLLGNKRALAGIAASALAIVGMQYALTPHSIVVTCDYRWTPEIQKALKKEIEHLSLRSIGATWLRKKYVQDYPCLKDVSIVYKSSQEATVKLKGWRPLVLLRSSLPGYKEYIVCKNRNVMEKHYFTQSSLQGLPSVVIIGGNFEEIRQLPALIDTALQLKSDLFQKYTITWHSKTKVCLQDKHKPITIITDCISIHEPDRYAYVERIFDTEKKYSKGMKADIRLKDSLVCAPSTKGTIL